MINFLSRAMTKLGKYLRKHLELCLYVRLWRLEVWFRPTLRLGFMKTCECPHLDFFFGEAEWTSKCCEWDENTPV